MNTLPGNSFQVMLHGYKYIGMVASDLIFSNTVRAALAFSSEAGAVAGFG